MKQSFIQKLSPQQDIRPLAFLLSICLSFIWLSYQQPINIDGITYLQTAQLFIQSGFTKALHNFDWPFYPILFGIFSKLTGLSLYASAFLLNTFFIALITTAFVSTVKNLGANSKVQVIAAFVILLYPTLAHERTMFVRDFGYYALMLLSLNALIKFQDKPKYTQALQWALFTLAAGFFRIEGFVFLIIAPVFTFLGMGMGYKQKVFSFIKLNSLTLLLGALAISLLLIDGNSIVHFQKIQGFFATDYMRIFNGLHSSFIDNKAILTTYLLNSFAAKNAGFILIGGIILIFFINLMVALNIIYALLSYYGFKHNLLKINFNKKLILIAYVLINCVILFVFLSQSFFITTRYIMFLAMILLLPVPASIFHIYSRYKEQLSWRNKYATSFTVLVLALTVIAISALFHIGTSKTYIVKAGHWIQKNTATKARFYMNSPRLTYYANRPGRRFPEDFPYGVVQTASQLLKDKKWYGYDYLALTVRHKNIAKVQQSLAKLKMHSIKIFSNNRGDEILIVPVRKQDTNT